jgi:hypothetical protein
VSPLAKRAHFSNGLYGYELRRLSKLIVEELTALQSTAARQFTAASPLTGVPETPAPRSGRSPELPFGGSYASLTTRECPETPTPSTKPLGSPIKRTRVHETRPLTDERIDPTLLQVSESASVLGGSNDDSSTIFSEDDEISEDRVDVTVIRKKSSEAPPKKRLTADEVTLEQDSRKRDTYYRNMKNRIKESFKKLSNYTECYGILLIIRNVFT